MLGKILLSAIGAALIVCAAAQVNNTVVQVLGAVVGSGLFGFITTRIIIREHQQRKARIAHAEAYLENLRRINQQRSNSKPAMPIACRGCTHYHGRTYNGSFFVCAMHPYGAAGDVCLDWEADRFRHKPNR